MSQIVARTRFRDMMSKGIAPLGAWITMGDPLMTIAMARAGLDFVLIDCEHGAIDMRSVREHIRASELHHILPVVRVLRNDPAEIQTVLDAGAQGILIPKISTAQDAIRAVAATRYQPGGRGMCPAVEGARWATAQDDSWNKHKQASNENIIVIALIETAEAMANLEEICAVPGLDFIYFGRADLSQDMDLDQRINKETLLSLWNEAKAVASRHGVHVGSQRLTGFDGNAFATIIHDVQSTINWAKEAIAAERLSTAADPAC